MFQYFKDCLFNNKNAYRSQQRFKSYNHDVYTEDVNKIASTLPDLGVFEHLQPGGGASRPTPNKIKTTNDRLMKFGTHIV